MLKAVLMISRPKDNKHLLNFKTRMSNLLIDDAEKDYIDTAFNDFVSKGRPGEVCRMYTSYNEIDEVKVNKELAKYLVDELFTNSVAKLDTVIYSLACKNFKTKHWLLDYDSKLHLDEVLEMIPSDIDRYVVETLNGYAIVVDHGFDTREILKRFEGVLENKKTNGLLFVRSKVND